VSMIRKGNIKEGINLIPLFTVVSFIIFTLVIKLLSSIIIVAV